jgi:hypothetical protein
MSLHRQRAQKYLQQFDFESLFIEELGWDRVDRVMLPFEVEGESFEVVAIAQKRSFTVFKCITPEIPARPLRVKLDRVLAQHYGFTAEELDFIINYDIKYRMGRDSGGDG